jgi:hypothetical protein
MGSTAIQLIAEAYRQLNLTEPTSFGASQEFPLNIAKDVLNKVIREMNRLGNLWFTETATLLAYSGGVYTWDLSALNVDPKRIRYVRKEALNHQGELAEYPNRTFRQFFRGSAVQTAQPTGFTKSANTFELNCIPDQDYQITIYHFRDMPAVTATTDTLLVPERDEDILTENCLEWLNYRMGKQDKQMSLMNIRANTIPFLVQVKSDAGMPKQMPAAF